jgi:hypothetical protein
MMRNVMDGFGKRNQTFQGGTAKRGGLDLDTLTKPGGTEEAKRLGMLEAGEIDSDDEDGDGKAKEVEEELDEAAMLAKIEQGQKDRLNKRARQAANLYESDEDEDEAVEEGEGGEKREYDSEDEAEKAQMNAFSKRAKMNRVLQDAAPDTGLRAMEADEESRQIALRLTRTNKKKEHKRVESDGLISNGLASTVMSGMPMPLPERASSNSSTGSSKDSKAGAKRKREPIKRASSMGTAMTVARAVTKLKRSVSSGADGKKPAKLQRTGTGSKKKPKLPMQRAGSFLGHSNSMMASEGSNSMMAPMGGMSGSIGAGPQTVR